MVGEFGFYVGFVVVFCCCVMDLEGRWTLEHPCRGSRYNRAIRIVRGLDPNVG